MNSDVLVIASTVELILMERDYFHMYISNASLIYVNDTLGCALAWFMSNYSALNMA